MKTFAELKAALEEANKGSYKGSNWKIASKGSIHTLYVNDEKIDVYRSTKDAEKAAKEFIDLNR